MRPEAKVKARQGRAFGLFRGAASKGIFLKTDILSKDGRIICGNPFSNSDAVNVQTHRCFFCPLEILRVCF